MSLCRLPLKLRPLNSPLAADALLLESTDSEHLLREIAEIRSTLSLEVKDIFTVSRGFFLRLPTSYPRPIPGLIRLRCLGENFYIPVQAELHPSLLEEEIQGLTRERGLIFLPGERILRFDLSRPVSIASLLELPLQAESNWSPLPETRPRSRRILEIRLESPKIGPDDLFQIEAPSRNPDSNTPIEARPGDNIVGQLGLHLGRGLIWLGQSLNLRPIAQTGASWIQSALSRTPHLSAALLGKQEAALRDLLREFREGNLEQALRKALPLGTGIERGRQSASTSELPRNNLRYSLQSLLAVETGAASYWFGGFDVQQELIQEYRKAAEAAATIGDFRRAAFIYAKLLGDYRTAAQMLLRGGQAHDAGVLFLERVGDPAAAARAFEAAGEFDHALSLYRETRQYELAADLLKRMGETDAALREYQHAAEQMVTERDGYLQAGDFLRVRAGRPDLARPYYQSGWDRRPAPGAWACATQLTSILAAEGDSNAILQLLDHADAVTGLARAHDPVQITFYDQIATISGMPALQEIRDEIRDRARIALARTLRLRAEGGQRPAGLARLVFPSRSSWTTEFLQDAEFALRELSKASTQSSALNRPLSLSPRSHQIGQGQVTAAVFAVESESLFLGYQNGELIRYNPRDGTAVRLAMYPNPVAGIAVDPEGQYLGVLWKSPTRRIVLASYIRRSDETFEMTEGRSEKRCEHVALSPTILRDPEPIFGLSVDGELSIHRGTALVPIARESTGSADDRNSIFLLPDPHGSRFLTVEIRASGCWTFGNSERLALADRTLGWAPRVPSGSPLLQQPILSILPANREHFEIAGIGPDMALFRTVLHYAQDDGVPIIVTTNISASDLGFRAATLLRPGHIAAISAHSVSWLRGVSNRFTKLGSSPHEIQSPVACFPSHRTRELLVVSKDARLTHLPMP